MPKEQGDDVDEFGQGGHGYKTGCFSLEGFSSYRYPLYIAETTQNNISCLNHSLKPRNMLVAKASLLAVASFFAGLASAQECFTNEDCRSDFLCPIQAGMPGPFQCTPQAKMLRRQQNQCYTQEDCPAGMICPILADMPGPFDCTPESKKLRKRQRPQCYVQEDCPAGNICPIQAGMPGPFDCTPESRKARDLVEAIPTM